MAEEVTEAPASGEPWEGYDEQDAKEIVKRLQDSAPETAAAVLVYERENKGRTTVTDAAAAPDATFADDQYSNQQLIENSTALFDVAPFEVDVALRRFGDGDFHTLDEARRAIKQFRGNEIEEA